MEISNSEKIARAQRIADATSWGASREEKEEFQDTLLILQNQQNYELMQKLINRYLTKHTPNS